MLHESGRKFTKFTQHHVNEGGGGDEGGGDSEIDEARYNLATRVMSNGVELIVADGKSTLPGEPNFYRILTNSKHYNRPLTLAPSTLNNAMMLLTLGAGGFKGGKNPKIDNIPEYAILNRFVTKTCLTTYTYLTTYELNGSTMIESREKVISNIATEERNTHNMTPLIASDMTFFKTPNLRVGEFSTTYTYYNTIMDDDIPIVATSKHVVVNTITAADDYLKMIQPSPEAIPVYETNTYYSTLEFSKTINDDEITKVINTQDVVTQVIVTESLPHGRMPMSMGHDIEQGSHELSPSTHDDDDGENDDEYSDEEAEVHHKQSNKFIKKTNSLDINPTRIDQHPSTGTAMPLHLYATKTYLTTFTYFTTLLQNGANVGDEISSTMVDSHTRVIENVITESIAPSLIPTEILERISKTIIDDSKSDLKTKIRLENGQRIEITAANIHRPVDYATKVSSVEANDLEVAANDLSPVVFAAHDENENENVVVEESAEEIIEIPQEPVKIQSVHPKPKPSSGSLKIPSLLNGISMPNLPSFSAFGPVINAMAGILQSNFGSQTVNKVLPVIVQNAPIRPRPDHEVLPQPLPLFSQESQDTILSQTESKNKVPLYIPIHPNNQQHHHAAIMGSGISISPGDVITANSDVIVGRPAVIGPQLPPKLNKPEEIQGMEAPPPFVPLKTPQRSSSFVKDIKSNGNINQANKKGDDYIGPVPPKDAHLHSQNKPIPLNQFSRPPHPQNLQKIQPIIPPMMRPQQQHLNEQHRPGNILIPNPTQQLHHENNNQHFVKINHQQPHKIVPIRSAPEHPKIIPHHHHHHNNNHHQHHHQNNKSPQLNHHNFNNNNNNNYQHYQQQPQNVIQPSIIEIQKIPEVYSTDLPIITLNNHHQFQGNRISSITSGKNVIHELPEIYEKPTRGQPLLVDIQPSQVANVVIPHDSSSVLVFGGVHEAHKAGQYFNDPSPYGNAEIGIKSVNLLADINGNKYDSNNQQQQQQQPKPAVHYDVKDNIIVASENAGSPSNINIQVSPLAHSSSVSFNARPHQYSSNSIHSVNFSPSSVISFYPDASDIFRRPPSLSNQQQIINQQKQQQIAIDQQLKQKQFENQKRVDVENQKRQEFIRQKNIELQKRKEYEDQQRKKEQDEIQRRKEYEEQQRRNDFEQEQRRKDYEEQQRQKQVENQRKQDFERQKAAEMQKRQQEIENQKRIQMQQEMKNRNKNQIVVPHRPPNRPENSHPSSQHNGGFIVLSSNYNSQHQGAQQNSNQQTPFIPMPPFKVPSSSSQSPPVQSSTSNDIFDSELDGALVQESINRPKLPSGENHGSLEDEDDDENVKNIEDFDNFVYHKITGSSTSTAKPLSTSTATTRRISTIPVSTERISITTHRNVYIPRPSYPNHQFENLPVLVNDLQHRPPSSRPTIKPFQRLPPMMPQFKPNTNTNTISQLMKPPAPSNVMPPKISRRPTHPFGSQKTTFKISMPINPMPDDDTIINNLQTEIPFNPIYTQSVSTSSTTSKPTTAASSSKSETTTANLTEVSTQRASSEETTRKSNSTDLNLGEVERNKEKVEAFDDKDTVFHGYEKLNNNRGKDDFDLMPPSNKHEKPYHTINRVPDLTTYKTTNVKLEILSTELEQMKPPAPTTKAPSFVEIVNMKPPTYEAVKPPYVNVQRPTISLNRFTPSNHDPLRTTSRSKTTATTYRPPFRRYSTTLKPVEENEEEEMTEKKNESNRKEENARVNSTPVLTREQTKSVINTSPSLQSSISIESSIRKESNVVRIPNTDHRRYHNRTKINVEQIVTSTRWVHVTNTKTITLSKTKTEVINRSHGIPIKSTSVHTVYETITETETLLKPTVITTIQPTKTIIRETIFPSYTASGSNEEEEIVEGFVSQEDLDEFIINFDDTKDSIVRVNSNENPSQPPTKRPTDNDSILVVVSDKKNQQKVNLDTSIISPSLYNHSTFSNEIEDVSRGEEDSNDGAAGHILLGGILIATPPQLNKSNQGFTSSGNRCFPECNKGKNEHCHRVDGHLRCDCRPGFARMFVDRPCKPIYTYIMEIGLNRIGRDRLTFDGSLMNKTSFNYTRLRDTAYNGVDRMLMQSDLRDIYNSVEVIGFNATKDNGIIGKLFIQLSENTNESKLREIVKKYLHKSSYNLGGTDLYAHPVANNLDMYDFDECAAYEKSHDCSEFSHCFNLLGTYTCSCMEGFTDESENPIYPGRICVKELVGCERCHYHGTCITKPDDQIICDCFQWYTGQQCQVSLKLLLFGLVIAGLSLFMLLMICIIVTCVKKKRVNQNAIAPAMNIIQRRISSTANHSVSSNTDRKAMIQDTSSEASDGIEHAPYFRKKSNDESARRVSVEAVPPKKKKPVVNANPLGSFSKATGTVDQRDRSLTVMIPRAKYHAPLPKGSLVDVEGYKSKSSSQMSVNQSKLINYLDASPSPAKNKTNVPCEKSSYQPPNAGALVSAGFKVSAAGGGNSAAGPSSSSQNHHAKRIDRTASHQNINEMGSKYYAVHKISTVSDQPIMTSSRHEEKSQISVVRKSYSHGNLMESLDDDWLDNGNITEASEARSYGETMIQAPTKAIRNLYFKQMSHSTDGTLTQTEDMNTMAERDMASTVLLPHTHLYKPTTDRSSDISGFDSL